MNLKDKIIAYLERTKSKPYQLAEKAKVPATCIYRYLKGERGLQLSTAEKIQGVILPKSKN